MIKIKRNEKEIIIKGHAQTEDYGKDLVCAAVSTLVFSTLSSLTLPRKIKKNCVIINLPSIIDHDNQIRLETFWKSLLIIKNQYPDFINLQSQEKIILNKEQQEINLQFFASKKGVSSTKNGRDSNSKRLGIKKSDGSKVKAGNILYRQRGTKILAGVNVLRGGDDTLFSIIDGIVKYKHVRRNKIEVSVFPKEVMNK